MSEGEVGESEVRDAEFGVVLAGRYRLERLIGRGGVGAVYEAADLSSGDRVAVKLLDAKVAAEESVGSRFAREAKAASAAKSPHIARVLDSGSHERRAFLVLELLRGEDLGRRLRREHRLPVSETVHILAQLLEGLSHAHAAGIVHRDLKPDNILLVPSGADPLTVKIVDFGASKIQPLAGRTRPLSITRGGVAVGTPLYMSPEQAQARGDVDERSDLYSAGAIAFECLTGRPPHVGETDDAVLSSICTRDAPKVLAIARDIPPDVAAFIDKALARDRAERFLSARQMKEALAPRLVESPVPSQGASRAGKSAPAAISPWTFLAVFAAGACGAGLIAWLAAGVRARATTHEAEETAASAKVTAVGRADAAAD